MVSRIPIVDSFPTVNNMELVRDVADILLYRNGDEYENELQAVKGVLGCSTKVARKAYYRGKITQEQYNELYRKAHNIG